MVIMPTCASQWKKHETLFWTWQTWPYFWLKDVILGLSGRAQEVLIEFTMSCSQKIRAG